MSKVGCFLTFSKCSIFLALIISQLLEKTTATVFILGEKILSPVYFEYKTFSEGYLVDEVFSNPLNRFLTLPGPTYLIEILIFENLMKLRFRLDLIHKNNCNLSIVLAMALQSIDGGNWW